MNVTRVLVCFSVFHTTWYRWYVFPTQGSLALVFVQWFYLGKCMILARRGPLRKSATAPFLSTKTPTKKKNLLSPPSQFNHQMWLSAPQKNTHHYPVITGARPETAAPVHVVLPLRCCHEKAPRQWWVVPARHARPNEECLDGEFNCQLLPSLKMKLWGWKMSFILEWRGMAGAMYYAT